MPSFWETMKSDPVLWVILFCSVVAVAVGVERLFALWGFSQRARALIETVQRCLFRGAIAEGRAACERSQSPLADIFLVGFERVGRSSQRALQAAVDRERMRVMLDLRARLWMVGTVGALAPFVGLFGTVVGIMDAFNDLGTKTEGTQFAVVSAGISKALIATAGGLAVALIAVLIYNYFNQRLTRIVLETKLATDEFRELLSEQPGAQPASTSDSGVAVSARREAPSSESSDGAEVTQGAS